MKAGRIEFVEVESRSGEPCRMRNPWPEAPIQLQRSDGQPVQLTGEVLQFDTEPGGQYTMWPDGEQIPAPRRITAEPARAPISYSLPLPEGPTVSGRLGKD